MPNRSPIRPSERGYTLVTVIFLLALLTISLAAAAPKMAREIQRDREVEALQRGKQLARAIKLYYKKYGAYPPNLEALTKSGTGNIRFLRKKYTDPLSGKDDWKPVFAGQNKAPTAMGFFGQPLNTGSTGIGSYAGGSISGATSLGSSLTGTTSSSTSATTPTSTTSQSTSSTASNPTFGGAGIMGFSPGVNRPTLITYKTKRRSNEWEFVYDPRAEQLLASQAATNGAKSASTSSTSTTTSGSGSSASR